MKKFTAYLLLLAFFLSCVMPPRGLAQGLLPSPGAVIALTPAFTPAHLKGMVIDPANPFKLDFLIHRGDGSLTEEQKRAEYPRLIKYFLASLAIPDKDQWVNLSPYEKDRIVPDNFGVTAMGRDLLAQDYLLKQIAASLTNPDTDLGKKFWDEVYSRAYQKFGTTDVPTDTFNKVWIIPDKAVLYEKGNTVYVLEHHLKVMMEKDYLAAKAGHNDLTPDEHGSTAISQEVMRQIIIPAIEKEVNEGKNFAQLRQVYSGMLLAAWYKRALKNSILAHVYADRSKIKGIDQPACRQAGIPCEPNQKIYEQYVTAFKAGAYNMIREDVDRYTQEVIPRKYFSGGMVPDGAMFDKIVDHAERLSPKDLAEAGKIDASEVMLKSSETMPGEVFRKTLGSPYVIPEVDLFDPLYQSIRRAIFDLGDSRFNLNPLFVKYMAATIFSLCGDHEKRHMWVLSAIFQARLLAASNKEVLEERAVEDSLRTSVNIRLLGLPDERRGIRYSDIPSKGRYAVLYGMLCQRLASEGFNTESIPEGTRYTRAQEIGSTGEFYWQVLERYNETVRIYKALDPSIPSILGHLQELWGKMMADDLDREQRVSALAEYEWWFFQANPFGRGGASMGDAMSLVAQYKMGLPIRDKFEHLDFRALSMTLPEYKAGRVTELSNNAQDHGKAAISDFDPAHMLHAKIRGAISAPQGSPFDTNPAFGKTMAAAVAFLFESSEKAHLWILNSLVKARLSVASEQLSIDDYTVVGVFRNVSEARLSGLTLEWIDGTPYISVRNSGRYQKLYQMVHQRLLEKGFSENHYITNGVRYFRDQKIGSTGGMYQQIIDSFGTSIRIYSARDPDVPVIMRHLTELWDTMMDATLGMDRRLSVLPEYEWWFFQANPFGRGGAALGDAMSMVAQLKMGLSIRVGYENLDFRALSMTLPEYLEYRVAELKKNVPDLEPANGMNWSGQAAATKDLAQDVGIRTWRGFEGLGAVAVPEFQYYDLLERKVRKIMSAPKNSGFDTNYRFGKIMAAMVVSLFKRPEQRHIRILHSVFQARLTAAETGVRPSEGRVAEDLRIDSQTRFLGLPDDLIPATRIRGSNRYGDLYKMLHQRLSHPGFVKSYTESDFRRYSHEQEIGSTGVMYVQKMDDQGDAILLYNANDTDIPAIMEHLTQLWDRIMDDALRMDNRLSALAEYEWWFFQANPFGRGAASMGDAMSLVAQMKMGLTLRKKYEHIDFPAVSMTLPEYLEYRVAELKKNVPDQSQAVTDAAGDLSGVKLVWAGHIQQPSGSEVVVDKQGQVALRFAMALNDKQMSRERLDRYLRAIKGFVRFSHFDIDEVGISYHDWSAPESDLPLALTATDERDGDGNYILEARFTPPSAFAQIELNLRFVAPGGEEVWLRNDTQNNNFTLFNSVGMELMPGLLGRAIAEMPYVFPTLDDPLKEGSQRTLRQALIQSRKLAKFVLEMGSYYSGRERKILELFHEVNHKRVTQSPEDVEHICRDGFSWGKAESYFNGRSIWTFVNNGNRALLKFLQESDSWVKISFDGDVVSDSSVSLIRNEMFKVFDNDEFDHNLWHLAPYLIDVVAYIYGIDGISFRGDDWLLIKSERPIEDISRFPDQAATTSKRKVTGSNSESSDMAEKVVQPGGIDFAASNLDMQIKRDGAGVPLPVAQQDLDNIHIDGLVPVILNIRPAAGLPLFNGAGAAVMEGK